jgi:hypothetical protein
MTFGSQIFWEKHAIISRYSWKHHLERGFAYFGPREVSGMFWSQGKVSGMFWCVFVKVLSNYETKIFGKELCVYL